MPEQRTSERRVAALFVRRDSVYKDMPGVDAWDEDRDARRWPGGTPAVAHPPCRGWGVLRNVRFARHTAEERALGPLAVNLIRQNGGILEHPAGSTLWKYEGLPETEESDCHGGWTLVVDQYAFGHRAAKLTKLYIVGCAPKELPPIPLRLGVPTHVVTNGHGLRKGDPGFRSRVTDRERDATPAAFGEWLVTIARKCA
jgi:hypothetical protein